MKKSAFFTIKFFLAGLTIGALLICIIPIKCVGLAHILLLPIEKKLGRQIEFNASRIWLPGSVSLKEITVTDKTGRLYYCKKADIKYNLSNLLFKKKEFLFVFEEIKFYRNIGLLNSIANMLVISKMPNAEFQKINGALRLRDGGVYIKNIYAYNNSIRIKGEGCVDKDGALDCDMNFSFCKDITDKIPGVVKATLLRNEGDGWMGMPIKTYGNYKKPSLRITTNGVQLNIKEAVISDE